MVPRHTQPLGDRSRGARALALAVLLAAVGGQPALARDAGEVTLMVENPSNVEAQLFLRKKGRLQMQANVPPGGQYQADAFRGQTYVVFFACTRRQFTYTVRSDLKARWVLPRRVCR